MRIIRSTGIRGAPRRSRGPPTSTARTAAPAASSAASQVVGPTSSFGELPGELHGELVVVNDTKVVPARIPIETPRGEVLLLERLDDGTWEALARPTRRLHPGRRYGPVTLG